MDNKKDAEMIAEAYEINHAFARIVLSEGDVGDIARALAHCCNARVKIIDKYDQVIAVSDDKDGPETDDFISKEVIFNDEVTAYVHFIKGQDAVTELDLLALESAVSSVAFIMLKKQNVEEIEQNYRHEFLNDLVDGDLESIEEIIERSSLYELDLTKPYILVLINIESMDEIFPRHNLKDTYKVLRKTFNLTFRTFFSIAKESIVWTRSNNIIVLYPLEEQLRDEVTAPGENEATATNTDPHELLTAYSRQVAGRIQTVIKDNIENIRITVGLGRFYSEITELSKSYKEALTAVRTGKSVWGNDRIYHYNDLGFYRILEKYPHKKELDSYAKEILAPLLDYDLRHKTQLLKTLEELMANCGNQKATADKLYIHNKTMAYRKKKIQEILGRSLDNAPDLFDISMALKIRLFLGRQP